VPGEPDYVVIGHVTHDLQPDGGVLLGGTALYAGVTAARLGQRVALLTAGQVTAALREVLPRALVRCREDGRTTTFVNAYAGGQRTQYLREVAAPIDPRDLPAAWRRAPIVHLGPLAREIAPDELGGLAPAWLGATPQGWFRHWGPDGLVRLEPPEAAAFVDVAIRVLVLSEGAEEANGEALIAQVRARGGLVAITRGARGSTLLWEDQVVAVPTYPVAEVDPTGAGDVYAAALLIRLAAGDPPTVAAAYASAAGALSVTGPGTSAIPDDAAIRRFQARG
jgi:sugar/nucleoside kinase (ribokinase family)